MQIFPVPFDVCAQVVFHVARSVISSLQSSKLCEQLMEWFPANVSKNIQSTPVRHSHNNTLNSQFGRFVDYGFHSRYKDLATFQPKSLLRRPLSRKERFETVRKQLVSTYPITTSLFYCDLLKLFFNETCIPSGSGQTCQDEPLLVDG